MNNVFDLLQCIDIWTIYASSLTMSLCPSSLVLIVVSIAVLLEWAVLCNTANTSFMIELQAAETRFQGTLYLIFLILFRAEI